jgi:hypothetical protein
MRRRRLRPLGQRPIFLFGVRFIFRDRNRGIIRDGDRGAHHGGRGGDRWLVWRCRIASAVPVAIPIVCPVAGVDGGAGRRLPGAIRIVSS